MIAREPGEAARLVRAGKDVVLIAGESAPPVAPGGTGRLARMIGDPGDPDVEAAADEMDREMFGSPATPSPGPARD